MAVANSKHVLVEKLIMFLTDGKPSDTDTSIMQTLREENAKLGNKVMMFTYGFGKGLSIYIYVL